MPSSLWIPPYWTSSEGAFGTLKFIADQIKEKSSIRYDARKVKRSFSGTIPRDVRWYPARSFMHYVYYEPQLFVPRKEHEGKDLGWGTMNQWRPALTHTIRPKLIYTTAGKARNGYAAFVVPDEWYVKLHGGTSQQFNYTGLSNPLHPQNLGRPNNLTDRGLELLEVLTEAEQEPDALLYYIAGIWNSGLAAELLEQAGSSARPLIKIPDGDEETALAVEIAARARLARELAHLAFMLPVGVRQIPASSLEDGPGEELLSELGLREVRRGGGRFRAANEWVVPDGIEAVLRGRIEEVEQELDGLVGRLY